MKRLRHIILTALVILSISLMGCSSGKAILVGFAGQITGPRGAMGVDMRDGALLAIEEINAGGGVAGRQLKFIIKDDDGKPEVARNVDRELIDMGVVAILGHITSSQTAAVIDLINRKKMVLFSPASTSTDFSGKKDYFFRNVSTNKSFGIAIAHHIYNNRQLKNISFIYEEKNRVYSESLIEYFKEQFSKEGGKIDGSYPFRSGETNLKALIEEVYSDNPEALFFIAPDVDTALMCQYTRLLDKSLPFFSAPWAQSPELISKGGKAVEGLELLTTSHPGTDYPGYAPFLAKYKARFNREPGVLSAPAYEAIYILAHGLTQTRGKARGLPEQLTQIKDFPGVQNSVTLDSYGDVIRENYVIRVEEGLFKVIDTIQSIE